jgi:hypothetical protein
MGSSRRERPRCVAECAAVGLGERGGQAEARPARSPTEGPRARLWRSPPIPRSSAEAAPAAELGEDMLDLDQRSERNEPARSRWRRLDVDCEVLACSEGSSPRYARSPTIARRCGSVSIRTRRSSRAAATSEVAGHGALVAPRGAPSDADERMPPAVTEVRRLPSSPLSAAGLQAGVRNAADHPRRLAASTVASARASTRSREKIFFKRFAA